jgi:hypothetical protein
MDVDRGILTGPALTTCVAALFVDEAVCDVVDEAICNNTDVAESTMAIPARTDTAVASRLNSIVSNTQASTNRQGQEGNNTIRNCNIAKVNNQHHMGGEMRCDAK